MMPAKAEKLLPEKLDPLEIVGTQMGKLQKRIDRLEQVLTTLIGWLPPAGISQSDAGMLLAKLYEEENDGRRTNE